MSLNKEVKISRRQISQRSLQRGGQSCLITSTGSDVPSFDNRRKNGIFPATHRKQSPDVRVNRSYSLSRPYSRQITRKFPHTYRDFRLLLKSTSIRSTTSMLHERDDSSIISPLFPSFPRALVLYLSHPLVTFYCASTACGFTIS